LVRFKIASEDELRVLSRNLLRLMQDKSSQVYRDNVVKFGIPDDYVQKAFSEGSFLNAVRERESIIYLATENDDIRGFAQTYPQSDTTAELDRIIILPDYIRKGVGTALLNAALEDQKTRGFRKIIVNAGSGESHARRFYEKNGFKQLNETEVDAPWGGKISLVTYERDL
jgi:ribosomal protein S18 acetylase RimI-like enzyme